MRTLRKHQFRAMGTDCTIVVAFPIWEAAAARRAIETALAEVGAQERALSRFDAESDLSALNAAAGRWTPVGDRLLRALSAAVDARTATGGRYDPTVLPALVAAGYDVSFEHLRPRNAGSIAGWRAGAAIEVDAAGSRARLAAGSAVDLGGIGKGLAAASAAAAMRSVSPRLTGGLVDLGGDIAAWGTSPALGAWRGAVANPRDPDRPLGVLELYGGGVATSGRDRRRLGADGAGHHLIDPATGRPAVPGPLTVTVVAPSALEAEAHATALGITPIHEAAAYMAHRPQLGAVVVPHIGATFMLGRVPMADAPETTGAVGA